MACILSFTWSSLLLLSGSFLFILGYEFFKTQPPLLLGFGTSCKIQGGTGQTIFKTSLCRPGAALLLLPSKRWIFQCNSRDLLQGNFLVLFKGSNLLLPMINILSFVYSVWFGRINILEFCNSIACTRKGFLSIYICRRTNRHSLTADWICLQNTLQSSVAWGNELCHLQ